VGGWVAACSHFPCGCRSPCVHTRDVIHSVLTCAPCAAMAVPQRYIPETVAALAAIAECPKVDVSTAVDAAALLHQRYTDFTAPLRSAVTGKLAEAVVKGDKKDARVLLRFYTDLTVAGVFGEAEISRVAQVRPSSTIASSSSDTHSIVIATAAAAPAAPAARPARRPATVASMAVQQQ
jgi:hypothetical protein